MPRIDHVALSILEAFGIPHDGVTEVVVRCLPQRAPILEVTRDVFDAGKFDSVKQVLGGGTMCCCPEGWPIIQTPMGSVAQIHHDLCSITWEHRRREEQAKPSSPVA